MGARPQFIKAAALSNQINLRNDFEEVMVHTGQHYDGNMSKIFFDQLSLPRPNYELKKAAGDNVDMIAHQLIELNQIIKFERPDYVLVYGDTDTTLAGALVANKNKVKLVHVESGLRSFNIDMPEENNRKLTDCISDLLFTTDEIAINNLRSENAYGEKLLVGDIMLETLYLIKANVNLYEKVDPYALVTLHRPSNVDQPKILNEILSALCVLSQDLDIIIPVHPRVGPKISQILGSINYGKNNIKLIEPLGYVEMLKLLNNASLVLTDSGGLQKEAVYLQKPCVVLRLETEWKYLQQRKYIHVLDDLTRDDILIKSQETFYDNYSELPDPTLVSKKICEKIREHYENNRHH